jgi:nucleoside-diphosphate-sugar epimerase
MNIFITGATGFVGRNFLEWLVYNRPEAQITCIVRDVKKAQGQWPELPANVQWLAGDLLEPQTYQSAIQKAAVVFHIAALVSLKNGPEFYRMNTEATQCLLDSLAGSQHLQRLVCLGSISAIDRPMGRPVNSPLTEESPAHPNTDYGKSKWRAEQAVIASGIPYAILRPAYIYGPYPRPNSSIDRLIRDMQAGADYLTFPYPGRVSGIYVRDLAEIIWLAGRHPRAENQAFFVSNSEPVRIADALADLAEALRVPYQPRMVSDTKMARYRRSLYHRQPDNLLLRILFEDYFYCSPKKWIQATGHHPACSYQAGIERTIDWYRRHGLL